jgi:nucleoid-associated protein YgaU
VIERLDEDGDGTATMRVVPAETPIPPSPPAPPTPPSPPAPVTWVAEPGDSMWSKAESVLTDAWHRSPSDREVVGYWQALVEANRSRLADPHNADLIFVGQWFEVPAPPPTPA